MKKFLYGLIGLVVVIVAALLVGPGLWDWNGYKPEIVSRIKAETGRDMAIDGDLSLAVVPSPRLSVDGVRIANIPGAIAKDLARFQSLRVRIRFMPLLSGRVEVESVELIEPVIELERLADGRVNWDLGTKAAEEGEGESGGARAPSPSSRGTGADGDSFALDRLVIRGGRLVYRDAAAGTIERIENLNVEASAGSLAGPFGLNGGLTLRGIPLEVSASVGRIADEGTTPLELRVAHAGAGTKAMLSGGLDLAKTALHGKIEVSGSSLAALAKAASGSAAVPPPWLAQPFSLRAEIAGSPERASLNGIDLRFADVSAGGSIKAAMGERTRIDAALKIKQVDLDKLLAASAAADSGASPTSGGTAAAVGTGSAATSSGGGFALPDGIDGSLDISVESVGYKGRRIGDLKLSATLDNGAVQLRRLGAGLPGGGAASLTGSLTARDGKVSYKGKTNVRADNLRAILGWLGADVADVSADRLRKFTLAAELAGDQDQVQVTDLAMRLDASRIDGGITYALRERPAFGARFNIDQLNVDAYMPRSRPGAAAPPKSKQPATAPSGGAASGQSGAPAPLAVLDTFDANVVLNVGTLSYRRTPIQGLAVDAGLVGGKLTVRRASVRNVSGTAARIAGTLSGFAGIPVFNGSFNASSRDVTGLFRIAGIDTPFPPRRLGRFVLSGKADAGAERVKLDTNLELAGAQVSLKGELAALATKPRFDLALRARHPDGMRLARLFGAEIGAKGQNAGGLDLGVKAKGGLDAAELAARLAAVGAEVTFAGKLTQPATAPGLAGALEARHPDFVKLVRVFVPDYRPAKPVTGPLRLASNISVSGTAARLDGLEGTIGPTRFTGTADVALAGPKPVVTAKLDAGDIDLNTLLPAGSTRVPQSPAVAAAPAAPTKGGPGARRYSREPFDLSALRAYDGDIRVSAKSITWRAFRVDAPRMTATLKDSVATLSELSGKMFQGAFGLNGVLDARKVPKLDGAVKIEKANVGKALFEGRKYDITDGVLDFDMKVGATGRSQADMMSSLAGGGRFAVRNGAVRGFDLKAVSDRLKNIDRALDFLSIFQSAMAGGTTRFSTLDGTLAIDKGVVRTSDTKLVADAAEGTAKGYVDLPRWNMDIQSEVRLTEHANSPAFRVRLTGPPDQADTAIDYKDLQKFLVGRVVERGVGSLLKKVAPDLVPQRQSQAPTQAAPSQQQQQPQQLKPKDFIRGLLKNLGR